MYTYKILTTKKQLIKEIETFETLIAQEEIKCFYRDEDSFRECYNPHSKIYKLWKQLDSYAGQLLDMQ